MVDVHAGPQTATKYELRAPKQRRNALAACTHQAPIGLDVLISNEGQQANSKCDVGSPRCVVNSGARNAYFVAVCGLACTSTINALALVHGQA
jgi:hypothetical protein